MTSPGAAPSLPRRWHELAMPAAVAQVADGGSHGLLAMAVDGTLRVVGLDGRTAQPLAEGLDPTVPLATSHGRIAARRADGALWVFEAGRAAVSAERLLAPHAGLLVLPLAVIGVERAGPHSDAPRFAARYESSGGGAWRRVARSNIELLPDARPLQADVDGSGDGGHVVVLAGPDTSRYRHGVLGDSVEATRVVVLERHSLEPMRELTLAAPHVLEDIAPRRVALGGRDGLLTVRAGPEGGQLVLLDADPARRDALRIAALGPAIGTRHRWLAPTTDGMHWLAVHTPHLGGVLHHYRREGERLLPQRLMDGVSNHRLGSRTLDQAAWLEGRLWLPTQSGQAVRIVELAPQARVLAELELPGRIEALLAVAGPGATAAAMVALLEGGQVVVGAG